MNETALVTGANRGIGLEVARQLAKLRFEVWVAARNPDSGKEAAERLKEGGWKVEFVQMDVREETSIRKAFAAFSRDHDHLDVLVNNAGILLDESGDLLTLGNQEVLATLETNTIGPLKVVQVFSPVLRKGSRVINVSSGAGEICGGMSTYAPMYSVSKTALNAVTCQLAHSLRHKGVAVNAVCPGWVKTEMGGRGASRSVSKGAETIVWLAHEAPISQTGKFWRDKKTISW
jgi:NAD(P)-dependent dehydrogenase (short-subunit alcohol dehydrogenase family)